MQSGLIEGPRYLEHYNNTNLWVTRWQTSQLHSHSGGQLLPRNVREVAPLGAISVNGPSNKQYFSAGNLPKIWLKICFLVQSTESRASEEERARNPNLYRDLFAQFRFWARALRFPLAFSYISIFTTTICYVWLLLSLSLRISRSLRSQSVAGTVPRKVWVERWERDRGVLFWQLFFCKKFPSLCQGLYKQLFARHLKIFWHWTEAMDWRPQEPPIETNRADYDVSLTLTQWHAEVDRLQNKLQLCVG